MIECYLRFVTWDPDAQSYVGIPTGTAVEALTGSEKRPTVVSTSHTDDSGAVELAVTAEPGDKAALWFRCLTEAPFETRHAALLDDPDTAGHWLHVPAGLGSADMPLVFDINEGRFRLVRANTVKILVDGPAVLACLEDRIAAAERSIHLQAQYFYDDQVGKRLTGQLIDRAKQGVDVRVMFDTHNIARTPHVFKMKQHWLDNWITDAPSAGNHLRDDLSARYESALIYSDTSALIARLRQSPNVQFVDAAIPDVEVRPRHVGTASSIGLDYVEGLPTISIARVDHRKLAIFDGRAAVLGGHNVGDDYIYDRPFEPTSADTSELGSWHDVSVELEGPVVRDLQDLFRIRWMLQGGDAFDAGASSSGRAVGVNHPYYPELEANPDAAVPVQIARTTPGRWLDIRDTLFDLIDSADREILIETPFFATAEVTKRLIAAARRGVSTVMIFPDHHNFSFEYLYAGRMVYHKMLKAGVEVYEYQGRMTHAKVAVIDDKTMVGSANLNNGSMRHHYEVAAVIDDRAFTEQFKAEVFDKDLASARRIWPRDVRGLLNISDEAKLFVRGLLSVGR